MKNSSVKHAVIYRMAYRLFLLPVLLAGCTDDTTGPDGTGRYSDIETTVHQMVNQYRATRGLPPLTMASVMITQARIHSANMAAGRTPLDHAGFNNRIAEIRKTIPLTTAAENVAFNMGFSDPAAKAVEDWINSSGHRTNIEGDFTVTGIGVERNSKGEYYFTQIFGKE